MLYLEVCIRIHQCGEEFISVCDLFLALCQDPSFQQDSSKIALNCRCYELVHISTTDKLIGGKMMHLDFMQLICAL